MINISLRLSFVLVFYNMVIIRFLKQGELCFIIKQDAKNITLEEAPRFILGYTAGNDVSSRLWQRPPRAGGQYCYAKGFDKFAPIGPTVRNATKIDLSRLTLRTRVNGEERQNTSFSSMIFHAYEILAHLSKGCTLRKGTVVMTGTPSGIAGRMAQTPWLQHGDIVEVAISQIGSISNRMVIH
jgi:2-keto-4-pentenoate hydratase/2-oxohepta-3-ene-1,7-dioic acid hydratase in catechol pathway